VIVLAGCPRLHAELFGSRARRSAFASLNADVGRLKRLGPRCVRAPRSPSRTLASGGVGQPFAGCVLPTAYGNHARCCASVEFSMRSAWRWMGLFKLRRNARSRRPACSSDSALSGCSFPGRPLPALGKLLPETKTGACSASGAGTAAGLVRPVSSILRFRNFS